MKTCLMAFLLLCGTLAYGQQQAAPPLPPGTTPPTFPSNPANPEKDMPPDSKAPAAVQNAPGNRGHAAQPKAAEVQAQIQKKLDTEPSLSGTKVQVKVAGNSVMLSGSVTDEQQHQTARRIAQSLAGSRQLTDVIRVQGGEK